jgi:hypothetical protein
MLPRSRLLYGGFLKKLIFFYFLKFIFNLKIIFINKKHVKINFLRTLLNLHKY